MTNKILFTSDYHAPDNIALKPIFDFAHDFKPTHNIFGGDIIDVKELYNVDSLSMDLLLKTVPDLYQRDLDILNDIVKKFPKVEKTIYLEGNHEQRYSKLVAKYPKSFKYDLKSVLPKGTLWVSYGTYDSIYKLADTIFLHGNVYPDAHAKAYANAYPGYKVVYGHLHHFQAYTNRRALVDEKLNFAVTAGCLCHMEPEYKKGQAHQWQNGFLTAIGDSRLHISTYQIEKGEFYVGSKCYK